MAIDAVILAGGEGRRLQPLVSNVPKPMAPIQGQPFLELLMSYWLKQGVNRFILAVGYKAEVIQKHFGAFYQGACVEYSIESKPLGTGGGLSQVFQTCQTSQQVLVLNGDTFFDVALNALKNFHDAKQSSLTMSLNRIQHNERYGYVHLDNQQRITKFSVTAQSDQSIINGGVYLLERDFFMTGAPRNMKTSLESDLLPQWLVKDKPIYGFVSEGQFIDIGIPKDYKKAQQLFSK